MLYRLAEGIDCHPQVDLGCIHMFPIVFGTLTFVSTLIGGLFAVRYRKRFGILAAFAAGVLIAVSLFDLLPETFSLATKAGVPLEHVMYVAATGFISLLILERYFSVHRVCLPDGSCSNVHHHKGGLFAATELSAHSFMDGLAIGIGFQIEFHVGIIVAFAVIAHDFSDGLNTVTVMLKSGNSLRSSIKMLLLDAIAPLLGALSTLAIRIPESYLILLLPFFAGGFLYLGSSDLLPQAHEMNDPLVSIVFTLLGFLLIFVITNLLGV
jgi:zinc transporter ZupT